MATIRKSAVRERVNNPLNIKVHRGTHQIGGCVTEYEYDGWHLFVDYGEELPGAPVEECATYYALSWRPYR